jgi:hypothetical protein
MATSDRSARSSHENATPIQLSKGLFKLPALPLDDKFALCCGALYIDADAKPAIWYTSGVIVAYSCGRISMEYQTEPVTMWFDRPQVM